MNAITIAHLSDIHHNPDENSQISTLLREKGLLVEKLLDQCLETLKQRKPDIVLITGDMTPEGTSSHYRYLHDALSSALPGTPVLCAMGNHDVRGAFREGFLGLAPSGGPYYASASVKGWLFVSLDLSLIHICFFELFEVLLSYFSNTLSFVRVGAFAVSHAAMMQVVLMLSGAETGHISSPVIVLGNLFVCGMEGLVVGIQVLRLEYYELFSRFSVSYTHLDVYKRQPSAFSSWPLCCRPSLFRAFSSPWILCCADSSS